LQVATASVVDSTAEVVDGSLVEEILDVAVAVSSLAAEGRRMVPYRQQQS